MKSEIEELQRLLENAKNPVFFGGAGVSTASGIPDFRSVDGLYNLKYEFPPETILSHSFFVENPSEFYKFYFDKMVSPLVGKNAAKPNGAHLFLANSHIPVVTQNIDGLHLSSDKNTVYELHGSVHRNHCQTCSAFYDLNKLIALSKNSSDQIPLCSAQDCKGIVKPDVVLYEEGLPGEVWSGAQKVIENSDLLIVGGTSLTVYPASSLVRLFRGSHLVLINRDSTFADESANLVIREPIEKVFEQLK